MQAIAHQAGFRPASSIAPLVESIGTEQFGTSLIQVLNFLCGAEHCALFRIEDECVSALALGSVDPAHAAMMIERYVRDGVWRHDPAISQARAELANSSAGVIRVDFEGRAYAGIRSRVWPRAGDRFVVCGRRAGLRFGLSVIAPKPFESGAIDQVAALAETLVAAMAKHLDIVSNKPNLAHALATISEIEGCFAARSQLPRRELEVCARILFGLSSTGISLDLSIGEESVKTYRKRAYQRLSIGSERELLHWYLEQWSGWRGHLYMRESHALH